MVKVLVSLDVDESLTKVCIGERQSERCGKLSERS